MAESPLSPHLATPVELQERMAVERTGEPFIVYRDREGRQRLVELGELATTLGRASECDIPLYWDGEVSRVHAELRQMAGQWVVVDDGLSRNGTFVNGERVVGRRRLFDNDQMRVGETVLVYREPVAHAGKRTSEPERASSPEIPPAQRRVLLALCRPYADGATFAKPTSNQAIADELYLSVPAIKTHLRALFDRFEIQDLPQNEKRTRLVKLAFDTNAISPADLKDPQ
jgi:pSer/pThr/pTyr-binding forkhead associated (FHA) protein